MKALTWYAIKNVESIVVMVYIKQVKLNVFLIITTSFYNSASTWCTDL